MSLDPQPDPSADALLRFWQLRQQLSREFTRLELTLIQATLLVQLATQGEPSQLLPLLAIGRVSLSIELRKLENRGLIQKQQGPSDGRTIIVKLTPAGIAMRERVLNAWEELGSTQGGLLI